MPSKLRIRVLVPARPDARLPTVRPQAGLRSRPRPASSRGLLVNRFFPDGETARRLIESSAKPAVRGDCPRSGHLPAGLAEGPQDIFSKVPISKLARRAREIPGDADAGDEKNTRCSC
jgi:hypothetical protein